MFCRLLNCVQEQIAKTMGNYNREHLYKLTNREIEVLTLMSQAMSNREISEYLGVGIEAVRLHAKNIYAKLEVSGRQKASLKAQELGLINIQLDDKSDTNVNLPSVTLSFVGRTAELGHLHQLQQSQHRLITILGAGGMGKTQLALAYSHQVQDQYPDGVVFVPLDAVTKPNGIILQMVDSLHLKLPAHADYQQEVLDYLADKNILLIMDNFEHLLDGAVLLTEIINATVDVKLIVTSRERLSLSHETPFLLSGLSFPDTQNDLNTGNFEAIELVKQLAQQIVPGIQLDTEDSQYIVQLCQLTEGMPLGIMLAMSWLDVYELPQIIKEIQNNIDFLQTDMQDIPKRHRNIRSVFEWTWSLLSSEEQDVFMRLSVFRNGCTLEAIETIANATPNILRSLVSKSLIYRSASSRYYLHELIRQYGQDKLHLTDVVAQEAYDRHARYYVHIAEQIVVNKLIGDDAIVEMENLYAGWYWIVETSSIDLLWRCIGTYGMISYQLSKYLEIKMLYDYALSNVDLLQDKHSSVWKGLAIVNASVCMYVQDRSKSQALLQQVDLRPPAIDWEKLEPEALYVYYHYVLAYRTIDHIRSCELLFKIVDQLEKRNHSDDLMLQTVLTYSYSQIAYIYSVFQLQHEAAKVHAIKALNLAREITHNILIAMNVGFLGQIEYRLRNYKQASYYFEEAIHAFSELQSPFDFGYFLCYAGQNALAQSNYEDARNYLRRALDLLKDYGLIYGMVMTICAAAQWRYTTGDIMGATVLISYCLCHDSSERMQNDIQRITGELDIHIDPDMLNNGQERARKMTYNDMLYKLSIWLADE